MKEVHIVVAIALDPQRPHVLYAGTTGGAYRSTNGGATWQKVNNGLIPPEILDASLSLGVNALVVDPRQSDIVYAGTTKGLFKSTDMAETWKRIGSSLADQYISCLAIDPRDPKILYAGGRAGVQKSTDGGETWQGMNIGLQSLNIRTIAISALDSQTIYVGTNGSGLYRSRNGGQEWRQLPLIIPSPSNISS
jgi:photosystem II stability/assembly factor-like uncharacterized protein